MHFKMLNIARGMLHSNHTEIIFLENYNNSSQFMETLWADKKQRKGWNNFFADDFPFSRIQFCSVRWLGFGHLFFLRISHKHTNKRRERDLLHARAVGRILFLWINFIFLLRGISSFSWAFLLQASSNDRGKMLCIQNSITYSKFQIVVDLKALTKSRRFSLSKLPL